MEGECCHAETGSDFASEAGDLSESEESEAEYGDSDEEDEESFAEEGELLRRELDLEDCEVVDIGNMENQAFVNKETLGARSSAAVDEEKEQETLIINEALVDCFGSDLLDQLKENGLCEEYGGSKIGLRERPISVES